MVKMYHSTCVTAGACGGAATLPFTGSNLLWAVLAGFAMLAVGLALRRLAPRRQA
jgi:hypothetical protein